MMDTFIIVYIMVVVIFPIGTFSFLVVMTWMMKIPSLKDNVTTKRDMLPDNTLIRITTRYK